jgi:hypothetical protein
MEITIRNFKGIEKADIPLNAITLIAGINNSGKSSIAQAVGAILSRSAIPIEGILKNQAGVLVKRGSANAQVELKTDHGSVRLTYPECKLITDGEPLHISEFAAGIKSLVDLDDKTRSSTLLKLLKGEPTFDDLEKSLKGHPITEIEEIWKYIQGKGWDRTYDYSVEKGKEYKSRWRQVAGETYGSDKGGKWLPKNWENNLMGTSQETLTAALATERDTLESLLKMQAVDEHEYSVTQEKALGFDLAQTELKEAQEKEKEAQEEYKKLCNELNNLPQPEKKQQTTPCPHCKKPIVVFGGKLEKPHEISDAEIAHRLETINAKKQEIETAVAKLKSLSEMAIFSNQIYIECKKALEEMKKYDAKNVTQDKVGLEKQIEKQRGIVRTAELRIEALKQKLEADKLHENVISNQRVIDCLAPTGLRQRKLESAVEQFNSKYLIPLSRLADWPEVRIEPDLKITYGQAGYSQISESEKFRTRVILQIGLAKLDDSQVVIVDAADILDGENRNGLFTLLSNIDMATLLTMTADSMHKVPNLAEHGLGITYWLDGAVAQIVQKETVAA